MGPLLNIALERIQLKFPSRKEQTQDIRCSILELPPEIIVYLSGFLKPSNYILFSHTCRSIYSILGTQSTSVCRKNQARCTRREHINYLSLLSRDLLDYWVCEACTGLHVIDQWDLPSRPIHSICPLGLDRWKERVYNGRTRIDTRFIALEHRHVQLTLKYMRTHDPKYSAYLHALLKPHHVSRFPPYMEVFWSTQNSKYTPLLEASYSARPKIVFGLDGQLRFLLLSTWTYKYMDRNIAMSRETLGDLAICPHTQFRSSKSLYYARASQPGLEDALDTTIEAVEQCQHESMERSGSCPQCPTDFTVRATRRHIEIRAWQDLGTEGSPRDLAWRVHTMGLNFRENRDCVDCSIPHPAGSVRDLFNDKKNSQLQGPRGWENILNRVRRFWTGRPAKTVIDTPVDHPQDETWDITMMQNINKPQASLGRIGELVQVIR
ncbi:hypothetical protein K445DRAFT_379381 [Daldinia sp. EC12]|nr:hypothetical protein K445DRAFT_379381 [Daldinia sp. EC12]